MRPGPIVFLVVVCTAVALVTTCSLERLLLLAPVIVVGGAAIAGLTLVWTRALMHSLRGR